MQQHQHQYIDRQRPRLMDNSNKTRIDEFYTKLERIRLAAAASNSSKLYDFNLKLILCRKSFIFQVVAIDQITLFHFIFLSTTMLFFLLRIDYNETEDLRKAMISSFMFT